MVTLDGLLATMSPEHRAEIQRKTDSLLVAGKEVKVTMPNGKLRDGVIVAYGYRGNVTKQEYWLVQVSGVKKAKVISEDKIQAA